MIEGEGYMAPEGSENKEAPTTGNEGNNNQNPPQGDSGRDWIDVFPDEAANDPSLRDFKSPDDFYKSYKSQQDMIGRKGILVPPDNAKQEDVDKFHNQLGRPEKAEGYKLSPVENLHKSISITPESIGGYQRLAHKHGLSQKQADGLNKDYIEALSNAAVENDRLEKEFMQSTENSLRKEWGANYEATKSRVAKAVLKAGGEDALTRMGGVDGIGNDPIILGMLGRLVSKMGEDSINSIVIENGGGDNSGGNETPDQAKAKLESMKNDPSHPVNDEKSPNRAAGIKERMRLYERAYPPEQQ